MSSRRRVRALLPTVWFCGLVVLVDTTLYAVLAPILADLSARTGLDAAGSGLLVAGYPIGMALGVAPVAWLCRRWDVRAVVALGMLVVALTSIGFVLADSGTALTALRIVQGVGGAMSWVGALVWTAGVAPVERRGELIGIVLGVAVVGGLLGPAVGVLAAVTSPFWVFGGTAVLCSATAVAAVTLFAGPPTPDTGPRWWYVPVRSRTLRWGMWWTIFGGLGYGVVHATAPLRMAELGWDEIRIGGVYLAMAAAGAVLSPLIGRLSDRRGRPAAAAAVLLAIMVVLPAVGFAFGAGALVAGAAGLVVGAALLEALYVPGGAMIVDACDEERVDDAASLAASVLVWSAGMAVAAVVAGLLTPVLGLAGVYGAIGAVALALVLARGRS